MHCTGQGRDKPYPDVQAQRTILVKVLTLAGYRVLHSASVCEAVQKYERLSDSIVWVWMVGMRRLCHHRLCLNLGRKQHFLTRCCVLYTILCSWVNYTHDVSGRAVIFRDAFTLHFAQVRSQGPASIVCTGEILLDSAHCGEAPLSRKLETL